MPAPFILDCDTGIDDSLAILYLLSDPGADVLAITTTFGNTTPEQAARNSLALLSLAGRADVPVSAGAQHPLAGEYNGGAPHVHGSNGIGELELPDPGTQPSAETAADTIIRLAHENPGELNLIAIGPLTNIALALRAEPNLPTLVKSLTIMGGAAMAPGNITAVAEANIGNDPEAAAEVFRAPWIITMVPLDVTMVNVLEEVDRQKLLASSSSVQQTMGEMLGFYFAFYTDILGRECSALHDPLAVAIATGSVVPSLWPLVRVQVDDSNGPGRGQTVCDLRGKYMGYPEMSRANCRVVLELPELFAPQLMTRLGAF
jgi:purine nucleosidase